MDKLETVAPAFIEMAHRIVWCSAATVDERGRPFSRVLHPVWEWDGFMLTGWIGTEPTRLKRAHLKASPHISLNYWAANHDTCAADCRAAWVFDDATRIRIWKLFKASPPPVGYDPAIVPGWDEPTSRRFAVIQLEPWRLKVVPGTTMTGEGGKVLAWRGG